MLSYFFLEMSILFSNNFFEYSLFDINISDLNKIYKETNLLNL